MRFQISQVDRDTNKADTLVVFTLEGDVIAADWKPDSEDFQSELERDGIVTAHGLFRPSDGKDFLDNLKLAFSNSSNIIVKTL